MFQNFRRRTTPDTGAARLTELRAALRAEDLDGFLVPRADAHQGENVAACDERLAWLTGFTGSAGLAVLTRRTAAIFVDGRYRLQVAGEVDTACFAIRNHPEDTPADWLIEALPEGGRVGFDPMLHSTREIETLETALEDRQIALVRTDANPIDGIWRDRPPPPARPITAHPDALSGRSATEKRSEIAGELTAAGLAAAVMTLPDSIAWLLNIRGADIPRTPVPRAFAILQADASTQLFVDPAQADAALREHLGAAVAILPASQFGPALERLTGRIAVDKVSAPVAVADRIAAGKGEVTWRRDPCILPKACKTPAEIAGTRSAHLRDAVAIAEFLAWLDAGAPGELTEIDVATRLEAMRVATGALVDISFETIAASGPNGAIVHYRVSETSNRRLRSGDLLLVDSGGQYRDGTTDITRTIAIGTPPPGVGAPFTQVLRGLIAMSRLHWPEGLEGRHLDAIARAPLWAAGLDYDHGTGHGVGSFLGVHEGPQGLSRRSGEALRAGMILSIEPGFYREGDFGIRSENLAVVREATLPTSGDRPMLSFETLTLAPFDRRLIDAALMEPSERAWLDAYHARVATTLRPHTTTETGRWLDAACAPVEKKSRATPG